VVTWLSTRPVIESKRLTELLQSQVRYLGEPRTWCRMAPAAEPDEIRFEARIWRLPPGAATALAAKRAKHAAKRPSRANARAKATGRKPGDWTRLRSRSSRDVGGTGSHRNQPS